MTEDEARDFVAARCHNPAALGKIERYAELLRQGAGTQNLVAASTLPQIWLRHIADSVQLIDHVSRGTMPWLDLGAGAGLPGMVIGLLEPERQMVLMESRALRIQWLQETIEQLGARNIAVRGGNIRSAASVAAGVISARAFAPLPRLLDMAARFSTADTEWVLPKGRSAAQEIAQLPRRQRAMFHVKPSATDPEAGIVTGKGRLEDGA